jgi:hypothetical protein
MHSIAWHGMAFFDDEVSLTAPSAKSIIAENIVVVAVQPLGWSFTVLLFYRFTGNT